MFRQQDRRFKVSEFAPVVDKEDSEEKPDVFVSRRKVVLKRGNVFAFNICPHAEIPEDCVKCQSLAFMMCRKRHIKSGGELSSVCKDIAKLIVGFLKKPKGDPCHRCCERFENQHGEEIPSNIYFGNPSGVFVTGGYGSMFDNEWGTFVDEFGHPLSQRRFMKWYLPVNARKVDSRKIGMCQKCEEEMCDLGQITECDHQSMSMMI